MKKQKKNKEKKIWKYIKKCMPYFLKEKKALFILIFLSIVLSLLDSFIPAVFAKVLDFATSGKLNQALYIIIILFLVQIISEYFNVVVFMKSYTKIQDTVTNSIRKDVIASYYEIESSELLKTPSGVFLTRITQDPNSILIAFNTVRSNLVFILNNLFVIFYVFYINWVIGLIVILGTILVYLTEKKAMDKWNEYNSRRNNFMDKNISMINEGLKGVLDIKLLNITKTIKNRIYKDIDNMSEDTIKSNKIDNLYGYLSKVLVNLFSTIILVLSIIFIKNDIMKISGLIALFMYKDRLFTSILYLAWGERNLKEFSLAAERVFEVIDNKKYSKESYGNIKVNHIDGKIEFKNVYFKYDKDDVLKGVNFTIEPKETVAIVGKSGSGKSTIVNLASKLYKVNKGEILIDGYNINNLDKNTIRDNIAVISQKPYLFNMSIKDNLLIVNPDANQNQIENVCKICEIHDYIMSLPKKYDTLIGEGGVNLSGGEAQRIAIARALLKKSKIILFDEATSALDNETQANIQNAINNISSEYTMLIIAHRFSTIKDCDRILVVDSGKIIATGTHSELYKNNKIYKNLYEKELLKQ